MWVGLIQSVEDLKSKDWGFLKKNLSFFFFKDLIFKLFLAALGLRFCARSFFSCGERGLLFAAVRGLLRAVASLVVEHGL